MVVTGFISKLVEFDQFEIRIVNTLPQTQMFIGTALLAGMCRTMRALAWASKQVVMERTLEL